MNTMLTLDEQTGQTVHVEVLPELQTPSTLPWWFTLVPASMQALTKYPAIYHRDKYATYSLRGFLHEYAGHWTDQRNFAKKYPAWIWNLRYTWRWIWSGFSYHKVVDEQAAQQVADHMRAWWFTHGRYGTFTVAMQEQARAEVDGVSLTKNDDGPIDAVGIAQP